MPSSFYRKSDLENMPYNRLLDILQDCSSQFDINMRTLAIQIKDDPEGDLDDGHALANARNYAVRIRMCREAIASKKVGAA